MLHDVVIPLLIYFDLILFVILEISSRVQTYNVKRKRDENIFTIAFIL